MEPTTIIKKDRIMLLGFSFFGDPFQMSREWTEENEIGRLWNRFMMYMEHNSNRIKHIKDSMVGYEVHIEHEETPLKGNFEVFVGSEIEKLESVPVEVLIKILPPTQYAVFALKGKEIVSDWPKTIYSEWMPDSGYKAAHRYNFQFYDQRFNGLKSLDESIMDVYIPVMQC